MKAIKEHSSNGRYSQIIQIIEKNPGIKFSEIMRVTGLKNGVTSHYLNTMEKSNRVKVVRGSRQTRFYPSQTSDLESKIIKNLRRDTPRKIIYCLMLNKQGLEFRKLVNLTGKSASTVSLYVSQLVTDDIVRINELTKKKKIVITNRHLVDQLIENYHPGMLDKPISGLEDIVNSL